LNRKSADASITSMASLSDFHPTQRQQRNKADTIANIINPARSQFYEVL